MLRRVEVRVALVLISCLVVVLVNYFVVNHKSAARHRDKLSRAHTSATRRRLLAISPDCRDASDSHEALATENDTLPAEGDLSFTLHDDDNYKQQQQSDVPGRNCRAIMHTALSCYCLWMLAILCDEYFIASIHIFCHKLNIKHELAAGTIMVMATSSPELCINCVSTFITDGDIGIGTIVGSTIFNVLAVTACCGFFARTTIKVDVFLVSRDCLFYALSIVGLIAVIYDQQIMWHEAVLMLAAYLLYLTIMYSSELMAKKMSLVAQNIKIQFMKVSYYAHNVAASEEVTEITPLFVRSESCGSHHQKYNCSGNHEAAADGGVQKVKLSEQYDRFDQQGECATSPWKLPKHSSIVVYIVRWPITFILWISVPDCRRHGNFYVVALINCVAWILTLSYLIASMITNVDSIMGMIFLGGCTSVPDAVYSVLATMKGNPDVGLSNAISANIYDILLCLGLPWSAKTLIVPMISGQQWITLNSTGITYSAISLLATLGIFYLLLAINRFRLDKKFGVSCLLFYAIFLALTLLLELDPPFPIRLPTAVTINGLI